MLHRVATTTHHDRVIGTVRMIRTVLDDIHCAAMELQLDCLFLLLLLCTIVQKKTEPVPQETTFVHHRLYCRLVMVDRVDRVDRVE